MMKGTALPPLPNLRAVGQSTRLQVGSCLSSTRYCSPTSILQTIVRHTLRKTRNIQEQRGSANNELDNDHAQNERRNGSVPRVMLLPRLTVTPIS